MVRDRAHLADLIAWLEGAGVDRAFVVGGDAKEPGDFPDGLSLLRAMHDIGHPLSEIGIPCYPQGHAFIADRLLLDALREKAAYASYMTTQLCFDPGAIATWLAARRADGLALPVHIGVPGVAEPHKLLAISARIGVADTHRFLTKNIRFVARLMRTGGFYRPDGLLEGLAPHVADPAAADRRGPPLHVQRGRGDRDAGGGTSSPSSAPRRPRRKRHVLGGPPDMLADASGSGSQAPSGTVSQSVSAVSASAAASIAATTSRPAFDRHATDHA